MFESLLAQPIVKTFVGALTDVGDYKKLVPEGYHPTWLEDHWAKLFDGRNFTLAFGLLAFAVHSIVFYGRYFPYALADHIPALHKYKLQPNKPITNEAWWRCFKSLIISQVFVQFPMMFFFYPACKVIGFEVAAPFPSWSHMFLQICIFFVIEDLYHYIFHRLFHWGWLYTKIHKVHHEYTAPFGICAEYAHPIETIVLGQGTISGPLLYHKFCAPVHLFTMLFWIACRLWQTVEAHCGYDFPWALKNIVPFWAGADHHDYHHMAFNNNFASIFRWWDRFLGTDSNYRRYTAKRYKLWKEAEHKKDM